MITISAWGLLYVHCLWGLNTYRRRYLMHISAKTCSCALTFVVSKPLFHTLGDKKKKTSSWGLSSTSLMCHCLRCLGPNDISCTGLAARKGIFEYFSSIPWSNPVRPLSHTSQNAVVKPDSPAASAVGDPSATFAYPPQGNCAHTHTHTYTCTQIHRH